MSWINLGEVYYTVHRVTSCSEAEKTIALLRPMLSLDAATPERVRAIGQFLADPTAARRC
jgi:hypothetical protein